MFADFSILILVCGWGRCCCLLFVACQFGLLGGDDYAAVVCVSGVVCVVAGSVNGVVTIYAFFVCCFIWLYLVVCALLYGCGLIVVLGFWFVLLLF